MSALAQDPRLEALRARCSAYVQGLFEPAADFALKLAAEVLAIEHLLGVAIRDEDSAANQTVAHAFADPETVAGELLALSPGLMVVGSSAALPFSTLAIDALEMARSGAAGEGARTVDLKRLLRCALQNLPQSVRGDLGTAGLQDSFLDPIDEQAPSAPGFPPPTLFRSFDDASKQALGRACHAASRAQEASIGPARLALAVLGIDAGLGRELGLSAQRAGEILRGRTLDPTPPRARLLPPDAELLQFLARLPQGAGSLDLLAAGHHESTGELSELLLRHKLGPELFQRASERLFDPV